ncbi:MAG: ABC transporter permease [Anaerolineales bacterium]|nr:ABC transporter permease [Anaerolineales bacterium]
MSDRLQKYLAPVIVLIAILALWEGAVAAFQIEKFLLPRPSVILANFAQVFIFEANDAAVSTAPIPSTSTDRLLVFVPANASRDKLESALAGNFAEFSLFGNQVVLVKGANLDPILQAAFFTLREALGGFALGCTLGVLVALTTARWTLSREALLPFAIAANSTPIIAFAPIMNNWFGLDKPFSKMAIVAIMVFFPMMINTVRGLISVDPRSLELMRSYAASEFEILFKLRLPTCLPFLFNGFKVAAALSMIGAVVGEYFGGPRIALGVFITQEAALFRFASAWAAIIVACVLGIALYLIILAAERLAMPWHVSFRN